MTTVHPLIIIGAGPAGLTAAIYAARAQLNPLVIQGCKPGGQLMSTTSIENWPGTGSITGPELMINMLGQAQALGTQMLPGSAAQVDLSVRPFSIILDTKQKLQAHSIIIACGATPNRLHCPGEDTYWGKGVSTCAVCDGALYHKQSIVVVGGGNTSMESAAFLQKHGNKVTIVHIGDKLTAFPDQQKRILNNPDITIIYQSTVTQITGNATKVTGVVITNQKTGNQQTLPTDAVFLAIGLKPNTAIFSGQLALTEYGHIRVHDSVKTSIPGVFAAGDVHDPKYRQAIVSAGFGCMAALEAQQYLDHLQAL